MGFELGAVLTRAGLEVAEVRSERVVQMPTQPYPLASIAGAMLGRMVERGVATADEIDIATPEARLSGERFASGPADVGDAMFGAWGSETMSTRAGGITA